MKRAVLFTFALAACHTNSATTPSDGGTDGASATAQWTPVLEGLDQTLLSIWGTSSKDVWTVGGALGNGFGSLVIRFDGTTWTKQTIGGTETFWWVHGTGPNDVWLVGEKGRITHWDGAKFDESVSGTTSTLFGVWAAAPDDAWAVGGVPESPDQPEHVILHWDGTTWTPDATLPETKQIAFFKVWGSSKDDVYVVGEAGTVWHRTGGTWHSEAAGLGQGRLTTVTGCSASRVFAVGSRDVLQSDGQSWSRASVNPLDLVNDVNGVACAPAGAPARDWGDVVIVGGGSLKLRLANGAWQTDFGSKPFSDLHGAWADETGAFWGVGGNFNASPVANASRSGVVARFADDVVPSTLNP